LCAKFSYNNYHNEGPFIESFTLRFFENEDNLITEANRGTIQSFSLAHIENIQRMNNPVFNTHAFPLPRYFALFFNLDAQTAQKELENRTIRQALELALDKKTLTETVFGGKAAVIDSPFLPETFGFSKPAVSETPNRERALTLLEQEGYAKKQGIIGKARLSADALAHDLSKGDSGEDVRRLQQCLVNPPAGGTDVYPEGIVNGSFGSLTRKAVIRFQEKYADEVLAPLGLSKGTGKAGELTRTKLNSLCFSNAGQNTPLTITITTVDQSPLKQLAEEIKKQWADFGITVAVETFSASQLERDAIKPRTYQILLFGEVLGKIPDPFPFWHSSQIQTPGLNLSRYENKKIDSLLESARKEFDPDERVALFEEMQDLLLEDTPAIFLYDTDHYYFVSKEVQGIKTPVLADPSQRFSTVTEWFIKTKKQRR
jgi:ABC-type transport system substrate-binding protein